MTENEAKQIASIASFFMSAGEQNRNVVLSLSDYQVFRNDKSLRRLVLEKGLVVSYQDSVANCLDCEIILKRRNNGPLEKDERVELSDVLSALSPESPKASDIQVGGSHYKDFPIQPAEFCTVNKLGFLESCVIKRMCRWQNKLGIVDLEKAKHEIDLLIEFTRKAEKESGPSEPVAD